MQHHRDGASRRFFFSVPPLLVGIVVVALTALSPSLTETAVANGDTRTINLYHAHTHESISATYLVNGQYDLAVLQQLNWFLRDWRRDEPTSMDPRLFDVVWETYRTAGAGTEVINVVSAYRSPETNAMLRSRSRAVAKHSQHMLGKAMDTTMPGMPMSRIREVGMQMQRGGVGYYPTAGTPFVHLDVGSVRAWPRMTYDQLVRLFPDGKTVHLPSNGQPLAHYEEARAEIEARNNGAYVTAPRGGFGGFLARLFGGGSDEEEDAGIAAPAPSGRKQWASLAPRGSRGKAGAEADEEGGAALIEKPDRRARSEEIAKAEANLPRGETVMSAPPGEGEPAQLGKADKVAAVSAPLPPTRPASLDKPTALDAPPTPPERRAAFASLESAESEATRAEGLRKTLSANAPLPPHRPGKLAAAKLTPALASADAPAAKKRAAPDALAHLIDVTGSTGRAAGAAKSQTANAASVTTAPRAAPQVVAPAEDSDGQTPPMAYAPAPRAAKPAAQTALAPASETKAPGASVLGSAIGGLRSAARAVAPAAQ